MSKECGGMWRPARRVQRWCLSLAWMSMASLTTGAAAQEYPSKPLRFVVASTPGSTSDLVARVVAPEMAKTLNQPVIVENKPGAGQIVGLEYVAKQMPADGYTVAVPTVEALALLPLVTKDMRFDPAKELPIAAMLAEGRLVLVTAPQFPWKSLQEFAVQARANPGKYNYGASSSAVRIAAATVMRELGLDVVYIPFNAAGPYIQALTGAQIQLGVVSSASATSMGERLRVLAATGAQRRPPYLDVPTFIELKIPLLRGTGYSLNLRSGTPRAIIDKLHTAASRALQLPEVKAALANIQLEPVDESIEASAKSLADMAAVYGDTVRKAGIEPE